MSTAHTPMDDDAKRLASLGYKQEFKRPFTPLEIFSVGVSMIGLVPSIASVLIYALPSGGGPSLVWGWLACSFFITTIALSLAELGSSMPTSGGLYFWTYRSSSPRWRTLLAWMVGYINTITNIANMASGDWGTTVQIVALISIATGNKTNLNISQTYGVFAALMISQAALCSMGTRLVARMQNYCLALHVLLCLAVVIGLPAATPKEFMNSAKFALGTFENFNGWSNGYAFVLSFLAPLWVISLFDATLHLSEEATNANVAVPWAMVTSCIASAILGLGANIAIAFCMGTDIEGILASPIDQPLAVIFFNSFGQKGTLVLWSFLVLLQHIGAITYLTAASRQTFAFARDGALPFSRYIYYISPHTQVPTVAVWFTAIMALLLAALAFAGNAAIGAVFSLSVVGQYVVYSIPISARFLGGRPFTPGPFHLGRFSFPVGVVAVIWMTFMSIVFLFPTSPGPNANNMNYTAVVLGGVVMLSVAYFYFPKYGGIHWFTGPVANIDVGLRDVSGGEEKERESPRSSLQEKA